MVIYIKCLALQRLNAFISIEVLLKVMFGCLKRSVIEYWKATRIVTTRAIIIQLKTIDTSTECLRVFTLSCPWTSIAI